MTSPHHVPVELFDEERADAQPESQAPESAGASSSGSPESSGPAPQSDRSVEAKIFPTLLCRLFRSCRHLELGALQVLHRAVVW